MCLDKPKLPIIWNRGSTYCLITRDILYFLPILVCSVNTFLQTLVDLFMQCLFAHECLSPLQLQGCRPMDPFGILEDKT
jgi:hypothetical protein